MRFLALFTLIVIACNSNKEHAPGSLSSGSIDKIQLTTLNDEPVDLVLFKGKVVFINFWATWCKPCVQEMPAIKAAMDSLKNQNIEFLFASDETPDDIERFEAKHNFGFNYVRALNMEELGIASLPSTFIFDKDGKKVFSETGYRKWNDRSNIELLLKITN